MTNFITEKENRIVAKLRDKNGNFKKSVLIPTDYYPLAGSAVRTFHKDNTEKITDEALLYILDRVKYKIGCCYQNTEEVIHILQRKGYSVKSYVGWLFVGESQFPVHHCWAVVDDKHVIDLADDFTMMFAGENGDNFENLSLEEARQTMLSFHMEALKQKNHIRCHPMGTPSSILYYVGTECAPAAGRRTYRDLIKKFPYHECQRNCDADGYNPTQKLFAECGMI